MMSHMPLSAGSYLQDGAYGRPETWIRRVAKCDMMPRLVVKSPGTCPSQRSVSAGRRRCDKGLVGLFQLLAAHYGDGHWQVADVCFISCPGHHDFIKLVAFQPEAVGRCDFRTACPLAGR